MYSSAAIYEAAKTIHPELDSIPELQAKLAQLIAEFENGANNSNDMLALLAEHDAARDRIADLLGYPSAAEIQQEQEPQQKIAVSSTQIPTGKRCVCPECGHESLHPENSPLPQCPTHKIDLILVVEQT